MNVNFGLFPPIEISLTDALGKRIRGKEKGRVKKRTMCARALVDLDGWLKPAQTRTAE